MYKLNLAKFKNLRILLTNKYLIFINQNGIIKFNTNFYNFKIFDNILYLNLFKYNNDMNINLYFINIYYYLTYKKNELLLNYYKNYLITLYNNLYYLNYNYNFTIILKGVGYKFVDDNNFIKIRIGYSHFIEYKKDFDIYFVIKNLTTLTLYSNNKFLCKKILSNLKLYKKPNLYKGTGVFYEDEIIILKKKNNNKNA